MKVADFVVETSRVALILIILKLSFTGHGFYQETFEKCIMQEHPFKCVIPLVF
jgi:hypothetical protein